MARLGIGRAGSLQIITCEIDAVPEPRRNRWRRQTYHRHCGGCVVLSCQWFQEAQSCLGAAAVGRHLYTSVLQRQLRAHTPKQLCSALGGESKKNFTDAMAAPLTTLSQLFRGTSVSICQF
jgi:hypothetical protein